MPATVTSISPRRATSPAPGRSPEPPRRPFRDNPRLILLGIVALITVLVALLFLANGTSRFSPDFLSEFVLYALSAADLTMLAALVFVLARNIVKLVVERRKALPFARFRVEAGRAAPRHDAGAGRPRADRRQRADSHQHRSLVQRADGRHPVVREPDCRRLLPGAADAGDRSRDPPRAACWRRSISPAPTSGRFATC